MRFHIVMLASFVLSLAISAFPQNGYQVAPVTNAGRITGTVKWSGPVPRLVSFPINKDAEICDPDSHKTRDLERLIVGPQDGVANTVVFLKNITAGKPMDIPESRRFVDQRHCRYEPHILLVPEGGPLQMKSSDAVLHTIHMDGAATFNLPFPFPNRVTFRNMPASGVVNVKCNGGHVWMNAEIFVVPHPYYAVTDINGKFELDDVPPGTYEIEAWHEGWGLVRQESTFDVLTERKVQRPVFTQPRTWDKRVTVNGNDSAVVSFTISEK